MRRGANPLSTWTAATTGAAPQPGRISGRTAVHGEPAGTKIVVVIGPT
ncbi:hypothetical protein [Streptomyces sp. NPDC059604]